MSAADNQRLIEAFPARYAPPSFTTANITLGVGADLGLTTFGRSPPSVFTGMIVRKLTSMLRSVDRTTRGGMSAADSRAARSRLRFKKFGLGLYIQGDLDIGDDEVQAVERYHDLGSLDRDDLVSGSGRGLRSSSGVGDSVLHSEVMEWLSDHEGGVGSGRELHSLYVHKFRLVIYDLEWGIRGACARGQGKVNFNGVLLQQVASKPNECGLMCVLTALKSIKSSLTKEAWARCRSRKAAIKYLKTEYNIDKSLSDDVWQPWELAAICQSVSMSFEVYSSDAFRGTQESQAPIYARKVEGRSVATVRLMLVEGDQVFSDDEYTGHYMLIKRFNTNCDKCGLDFAEKGKYHVCKFPCDHCGELYGGSMKHSCPVLIAQARARVAAFLDGDGTEGINKSLVEEVNLIMSGDVDDTVVIEEWRSAVNSGQVTFLAGDAGTGKTFQVDRLVRDAVANARSRDPNPNELSVEGNAIAIVCPEAVACDNYRGTSDDDGVTLNDLGVIISTIHSFLSLYLGVKPTERAEKIAEAKTDGLMEIREKIRDVRILVIDEVGSCSTSLYSTTDMMLRIIRECNLPFGGIPQVIMTGDFRQRPGYNEVRVVDSYKRVPIFMSELWGKLNVQTFTLLQQRRVENGDSEDEKHFIEVQMLMSRGVLNRRKLQWLNEQCVDYDADNYTDPDIVHLMMTNASVYKTGHEYLIKHFPVADIREYPVEKVDEQSGDLSGYKRTYDQTLMLAVGAPVMFTTNRYLKGEGEMANGSVGVVARMEEDTITVSVRDGKYSIIVRRDLVGKELGRQFPLRLSYARTIHKSQGATIPKVRLYPSQKYIPQSKNGSNVALMYVGVSRVKSINNLSLAHKIENYHITVCARSVWYMKLIQTHSHSEVIGIIKRCFNRETMDMSPYMLYPFNMRSVDKYISIPSKKVVDLNRGIHMYTRDELKEIAARPTAELSWFEQHPYIANFHNVIYFDFETAPDANKVQTAYYVVARYWKDSKIESQLRYGVKADGTIEPEVLKVFCEWMMSFATSRAQEFIESGGSSRKFTPIRLVAYNGSSFDFSFVFKWMLKYAVSRWEDLCYSLVNKASSIVIGKIIYNKDDREMDLVTVWDPCLFLACTLDRAHKSFCAEKHVGMGKDVLPHLWIGEVGVEKAFSYIDGVELEIARAFPSQMISTVKSRIADGTLTRGRSDEWVVFKPVEELLSYADKDVVMMEDVVESFSQTVWDDIFPGECIPVWNFNTASALGFYATIFHLDDSFKIEDADSLRTRCKLHRLSKRQDRFCRDSVYGGRTLNTALSFVSSDLEGVEQRLASISDVDSPEGKAEAFDVYDSVQDSIFYLDAVGLYHHLARSCIYPYGKELELTEVADIDHFFDQFLKNPDEPTFPMFIMRLDVTPNVYDTSSAVPQRRNGEKKLVWTNEPIEQATYNSVHLRIALRRGYKLANPSRVLVWGRREVEEELSANGEDTMVRGWHWIGNHAQMFKESCDKWLELRKHGGAKKVVGKLIANSGPFGGMLKRDFHTESSVYNAKPGEECKEMVEYVKRLRNPAWTMKNERAYVSADGTATLMVQWEEKVDDDNFICSRASYIGSFILAYGHELIDNTIESLFGESRRDGTVNAQPLNGDTDSLFFHSRYLMREDGVCKLALHNSILGSFSDDLDGYYTPSREVEYSDRTGLPLFAKVLEMYNPAKKVYGMKIITPEGRVVVINPKTKGISKGPTNRILTGRQAREIVEEFKSEFMGDVDESAPASRKRKRDIARQLDGDELSSNKRGKIERDIIADYLEEKNDTFSQQVDFERLKEQSVDENAGGLIASSQRMKKHAFMPASREFAGGVDSYSIQNQNMTRHILKDGPYLPPGRRSVTEDEDPHDGADWSVPEGWTRRL